MKIATWNVNSIRIRLPQLIDWLKQDKPDVVAIQETKCEDHHFPYDALKEAGYHAIANGQKSYNGVAILTKNKLEVYPLILPAILQEQKRVIGAVVDEILILNLYVPNGQAVGSEKYDYKLNWFEACVDLVKKLQPHFDKIIILGDFNIAPETIDHTSANFIKDKIMISEQERAALNKLFQMGFIDSFRLFNQEPKQYTWWDYRIKAFDKNLGYRIDHILISEKLKDHCESCTINTAIRALDKPSDHAPVILTIK